MLQLVNTKNKNHQLCLCPGDGKKKGKKGNRYLVELSSVRSQVIPLCSLVLSCTNERASVHSTQERPVSSQQIARAVRCLLRCPESSMHVSSLGLFYLFPQMLILL